MAKLDRNYTYQGRRYGPNSEDVPQGLLDNLQKREAKQGGTQAASADSPADAGPVTEVPAEDAPETGGKGKRGGK